MLEISKSVEKKDHREKIEGNARYIADIKMEDMLHAKMLRSTKAKASINGIYIPELPEGYMIVDFTDIPGENKVNNVACDHPIFAAQEVNYIGQPILMVVGPDLKVAEEIMKQIDVAYEEKEPQFDMMKSDKVAVQYAYTKGDAKKAFKDAAQVIVETYHTGYQEQAYIETQGVLAKYEKGRMTVYGSMQCPYYVKAAVQQAMGFPTERVQIIQTTTGGGLGGKEDFPSMLGDQVAVAAYKTGKPVRYILNRREDMEVTTKRHPATLIYQTALDKDNNIIAMKIDITLDGGAYEGSSSVVLQRSLICANGIYNIPNLSIEGRVKLTNTVPNGAFRGFGAPQSFFAIETHMNHISKMLGSEPLELKRKYMVKQGDATSTSGRFHQRILLDEMIAKAEELSGYSGKRKEYLTQTGRFRKGIGLSMFYHGCGFTGTGESDFSRLVVHLEKKEDDTVEILASNTDMGKGLKTTFSKIVAEVLEIPLDNVRIANPDTDRVPNSGPTVVSRSLMIVGKLLERAALRLKNEWVSGKRQLIEEHYVHPDLIPWDINAFCGDAFTTYSWGVNVVEVEVDMLTAMTQITGTWGVFDVGTAIDEVIMKGQMEGGMLQGIGYASLEKMELSGGAIRQSSITDYNIPTAMDTVKVETALIDNPYPGGPFGAKGAGELTLIGTAPAYVAAVEQAAGVDICKIPVQPEELLENAFELQNRKYA